VIAAQAAQTTQSAYGERGSRHARLELNQGRDAGYFGLVALRGSPRQSRARIANQSALAEQSIRQVGFEPVLVGGLQRSALTAPGSSKRRAFPRRGAQDRSG
jgi:hypothetical protein